MKTFLLNLIIILFVSFSISIRAQTFTYFPVPSVPFFNYGLQFYAISIDKNSKMWISSIKGISKFDGVNWVNYDTSYNYALNKHITCTSVDANNNIWIGTDHNGIIKFDGTNWTNYDSTNSGLPSNYISSIFADSHGNIWIGHSPNHVSNFKISKFNPEGWSTYNCNYSIKSIAEEEGGNGMIWFSSTSDIMRYNQGNWTVFNSSNTYNYIGGTKIAVDHKNNVWANNHLWRTLNRYDGNNWISFSDSGILNNKPFLITNTFAVDEFNIKWFPVTNLFSISFFTLLKDTTWINDTLFNTNGISLNTMISQGIVIDSIGNKWLLAGSTGLLKLDCYLPATPSSIVGPTIVTKGQGLVTYKIPPTEFTSSYVWSFPNGFIGTSTADSIIVNIDSNAVSGIISVYGKSKCGNGLPATINITLSSGNSISELSDNTKLYVYPNPAKDKLTIESSISTLINYDITNLMGQSVYSSQLNTGKTTIDISAFAKGIYTIKLYSEKGNVVKKFVKE